MQALIKGMDAVNYKPLKWMLALVNGMDVGKSPDLMGGKEYKGCLLYTSPSPRDS